MAAYLQFRPSFACCSPALFTKPSHSPPRRRGSVVGMPPWAMRLSTVNSPFSSCMVSSHSIGSYGNSLKMIWVYASSIFAKMVNLISAGDISPKVTIRKPVNRLIPSIRPNSPVSLPCLLSFPVPAPRWGARERNEREKTKEGVRSWLTHVVTITWKAVKRDCHAIF